MAPTCWRFLHALANGAFSEQRFPDRCVGPCPSLFHLELTCLVSLQPVPASCLHLFGRVCVRVLPEPQSNWQRIDVELLPPCGLITRAMQLAVMDSANRDSELVAHSASKRARLGKREVMGIRGRAAAHKASLLLHELSMVLIAQAHCFAQSTDHFAAGSLLGHRRNFLARVRVRSADGYEVCVGDSIRRPVRRQTIGRRGRDRPVRGLPIGHRGELRLKPLLDNFGIYRCQGVLGGQISPCPDRRLIRRTDSHQLVEQALPKNGRLFGRKNGSC